MIDQYYSGLNRQEELNGAIYMNEFNRVIGYIKMLWRTLQSPIISKSEENYVESLVESYRPHRSQSFLSKMNDYLKFLQSL